LGGPFVGLQVPLLESWWQSMTTILIGVFPYRELLKATEDVDIELGEMGLIKICFSFEKRT
jgi:hypothetical protein